MSVYSAHRMICPRCKDDSQLKVVFTGVHHLTPGGSEVISSHDWDGNSHTTCGSCGFEGPACAFSFDEASTRPGKDSEISFEIMVSGMVEESDGAWILAASVGHEGNPDHYEIEVRRVREDTGEIDVIEEHEYLDLNACEILAESLTHKYPFAEVELV